MAKKTARAEPESPAPKITENEQMSDIVFILDKMELILQAVSKLDRNGRHETVPADRQHRNSFLHIDRYADIFENFLKNFVNIRSSTSYRWFQRFLPLPLDRRINNQSRWVYGK